MRAHLMVWFVVALPVTTACAASSAHSYDSALLCAAAPLALRDNPSPDGYGGKMPPKDFATVILQFRATALKAGRVMGDNEGMVDADINRRAVDLGDAMRKSTSDERHEFQTKLGNLLILCAATKQ